MTAVAARAATTLRVAGPVGGLDPAAADCGVVLRLLSRQLVTYEPRADLREWQAGAPVPDVAVAIPSTYNMGLGASHRGHVLHLRPDVCWDTTPARPVTAHDFVRGLKRMGNPVARSPALVYFTSTIRGMAEFCAEFSRVEPTAEAIAAFQNAHEIPGVFALDDETLVIEVVRPTPDFAHLLALPCASAAPVEYDAYLPGSIELCSNGPYRVARDVPGESLVLEPSPAWLSESDPVRRRGVDRIEIGAGGEDADLLWGSPLASRPVAAPAAWALDPYLVFNLAAGTPALRDVRVRRAVALAVDKAAIAGVYRRATKLDVRVAHSIVPPGNDAHDEHAHAEGHDPQRARALLAGAGFDGLTLRACCGAGDVELEAARSYAADLERAGIAVRLVPPGDAWDVAARSRSADWTSLNGRVFLQPLFESGSTANAGGYASPEIDALIERALEAAVEHPQTAVAAWREVERRVLEDVAVVPLLHRAPGLAPLGDRVLDAFPIPAHGYTYDLAALGL